MGHSLNLPAAAGARAVLCAQLFAATVGAVLLVPAPAGSARAWDEIAELFRQTRYDAAHDRLAALPAEAARSPAGLFWRVQLETDPAAALALIASATARSDLPNELRARLALEAARIQDARGRSAEAIAWAEKARDDRDVGAQAVALLAAGRRAPAAEPTRDSPGVSTSRSRGEVDRSVGSGLYLQFGAYADRLRAERFLDKWRRELPDLRLFAEDGPGGASFWKVREGPFPSRAAADARVSRLKHEHGLDAIVVEAGRRK